MIQQVKQTFQFFQSSFHQFKNVLIFLSQIIHKQFRITSKV